MMTVARSNPPSRSLADELEEHGVLSPLRTLFWLTPVADSLRALHAAGQTLGAFGPADLVIARHPGGEMPTLLVPLGPRRRDAYAAPELAARAPSTASDVYSMAAVAHRCLTGSPPSGPRSVGSADAADYEEVRSALASGLEPDPGRRTSDPSAVLSGIARLTQRSPWRRKRSHR